MEKSINNRYSKIKPFKNHDVNDTHTHTQHTQHFDLIWQTDKNNFKQKYTGWVEEKKHGRSVNECVSKTNGAS